MPAIRYKSEWQGQFSRGLADPFIDLPNCRHVHLEDISPRPAGMVFILGPWYFISVSKHPHLNLSGLDTVCPASRLLHLGTCMSYRCSLTCSCKPKVPHTDTAQLRYTVHLNNQ